MDKIQALDLVISDPFSILSFTLSMFGAFVLGADWESDEALMHKEMNALIFGILVVLNCLTFLSCHWSVTLNALLTCSKECDPFTAKFMRVIPAQHRGKGQLCQLEKLNVIL